MIIAEYIVFIVTASYSLTILLLAVGWFKTKRIKEYDISNPIPVSIVVACRNEEKNIGNLLGSLCTQNYSKKYTEIIIVDDHSEDNTRNIVSAWIKKHPNIRLLDLPKNAQGKKKAVATGVEAARSEVILTTDADCTMNSNWLSAMVSYYIENKPVLLSGPVTFQETSNVFHQVQNLEFLSLVGSGAGAIGINKPIMNNGANMLFQKGIYSETSLNEQLASGDDIFLLLNAKKKNKKAVYFIKSYDAIVRTNACVSISDFFNQRIRWTSKSKTYRDFDIVFTSINVALINISVLTLFVFSILNHSALIWLVYILIAKTVFDLLLLIPVTSFFKQKKLLAYFIPMQLIYPFYIVTTFIFGMIGKFWWKNRKSQ